jgi:hypothetical protein
MRKRKKCTSGLAAIDCVLIVAIVALLGGGLFCALLVPPYSCWCLDMLDAHDWSRWTWTGVISALIAVLAMIRYWPAKRKEFGSADERE